MENIISLDTNYFIWPKAKPFTAVTCEKRPEKASFTELPLLLQM